MNAARRRDQFERRKRSLVGPVVIGLPAGRASPISIPRRVPEVRCRSTAIAATRARSTSARQRSSHRRAHDPRRAAPCVIRSTIAERLQGIDDLQQATPARLIDRSHPGRESGCRHVTVEIAYGDLWSSEGDWRISRVPVEQMISSAAVKGSTDTSLAIGGDVGRRSGQRAGA